MRVEGVDMAAGAYRVAVDRGDRTVRALVPEHLLGGGDGMRPAHQTAPEALARQARALGSAIDDLDAGRTPGAPYDSLTLCPEPDRCPPRS